MRRLELKIVTVGSKIPLLNQRPVVFTNGCFDILHAGHVTFLQMARHLGRTLVVGLNSDEGVSLLKGAGRPVNKWLDRAWVLASIESVDYVWPMTDDTNIRRLEEIRPEIWCKGGDYKIETLNQDEVAAARKLGIEIRIIPMLKVTSTTKLIERIKSNA